MNLNIDDYGGNLIIERLAENGFEAYFVGGCVRDTILGRPVYDYDITTNAKPDEVLKLFGDFKTFCNGIKHGTISVVINSKPYEITTFRKEGKYSDNRHPDRVFFCKNINDDLSRRDFTCNAMAFSKKQGLIDNFGGFYDTRNSVLRAVGVPATRFKEDALRILRALRFCSDLSFSIETKTASAIFSLKGLLNNVSKERIYSELKKIFTGENAKNVLLDYAEVIKSLLPPSSCFGKSVYENAVLCCTSVKENFLVRFCIFCYVFYGGNIVLALSVLEQFKTDNKIKKIFSVFFKNANLTENFNRVTAKILLKEIYPTSYSDFFDFLNGISFLVSDDNKKVFLLKELCDNIIAKNECYSLKQLAVNGNDLKTLGISGKVAGDFLNKLYFLVISEKIENNKTDLILAANQLIKTKDFD